ncbi:bifunctional methylenetetrahydrofolate dehydrogenase/methenyltetrahydrofolate cyclohydrolase FolD [Phorcysia thermohydrogeniphila]|uniref:Bifunctional protein FolD n=1 Tax=Phorcysia thermohydrogeniphila TaxID=936138 RepID=A0A4R1GE41_9BACT|nr:bifunctional methylenetetrahydrofolate dehydrogenase/methenyltetrahydrofolate cyclohydrolase FolD [Phorcysia thermohydrogeniphila]TCK06667.1 methenyltetrahydrofolate cyclohydrolase /5,10-methylenetetrahydrofolate dehydrogenase (NADP+) [Phorcysia thermohydrogeniphila]
MAVILDGKELSKKIRGKLKEEVKELKEKAGRPPALAVVLVGNDPASEIYVRNKIKACGEVGIRSIERRLPANTLQEELNQVVRELNEDDTVDGIIVQLPLPEHLSCREVINYISPEKDVDGFHPVNAGKCLLGLYDEGLMPCTPAGVMKFFEEYGIELQGKNAVMVGHSNIVGKPLANMLLNANATVSVCHVYTDDLAHYTRNADILCVATGVPHLIKADMVKEGAVVIDIGISRVNGKIVGDVDFERVKEKASAITPVPGGVGPMTITMLLYNTVKAFKMRMGY